MFRRFLKFLKGDEAAADERFEGSYLDHLLEQIRPGLIKQLQRCPEHDPMLLVVVGVLRATMLNAWSLEMREPLVDKHTPGVTPPPPPNDESDEPSVVVDDTRELEAPRPATEDGPQLEPNDDSPEPEDTSAENAPSEATEDEEVVEADVIGEVDTDDDSAEDVDRVDGPEEDLRGASMRITEEIDVSELQSAASPPSPDKDSTVEIDRNALLRGALPRLDTPEVLQAGRVFLGLLIENDRLPTDLQLNVSEIALARDLLLGYFVGDDDFEGKARRLLTIVEKKFADGAFSQARLLLQLFHTDESTRITNDRNLFYEDMIMRLGIRRRNRLTDEDLSQFRERAKAAVNDQGLRDLFGWLDSKLLVKMHLLGRSQAALDTWTESIACSTKPMAKERFLEVIPTTRWRPVEYQEPSIETQVRNHVNLDSARGYIISQLQTCYFILRAVGDTGLEGYFDCFFEWTKTEFEVNGTTLMPILYNRSMTESASMTTILNDVYDEFFKEPVSEKLESIENRAIDRAFAAAMSKIRKYDFSEVAPGFYDLGGFVLDELFNMTYPSTEFAAKIHRIS